MVCGFCGKASCFSGVDGGCNRIGRGGALSPHGGGGRWRFCRGRPMCRPVGGSRAEAFPGGHIGPPLREAGRCLGTNGNWRGTGALRGGAEPAPYRRSGAGRRVQDGGVRSPRPTGATRVMPSNGPMYLRYSFRQPNSEAEFGASVMGIGPYALRGTRDGGRHAGSSCPTGGCGEPPRLPWVAAHSGASAARMGGIGSRARQRSSPRCPSTSDNPSVTAFGRASSLCTREPLGTGTRIAASLRSSQ